MQDRAKEVYADDRIISRMDDILAHHLERLIGAGAGIGSLPLNTLTIGTLLILAENRTKAHSPGASAFLTLSALKEELSQMGFSPGENFLETLQMMEAVGYVQGASTDTLSAGEASTKMSRLLDHVFPGMPGLHFVAYIAQTIQEVVSGRKDLDSAIEQFSQVLSMQGRRIVAREPTSRTEGPGGDSIGQTPSVDLPEWVRRPEEDRSPRVIGGGQGPGYSVTEVKAWDAMEDVAMDTAAGPGKADATEDVQPETRSAQSSQEGSETELRADSEPESLPSTAAAFVEGPSVADGLSTDAPGPSSHPPQPLADEVSTKAPSNGPVAQEGGVPESGLGEDAVENRIRAYEGELTAICPHCGKGRIETRKTSTDRIYYVCSEKGCPFVSWGRPYHLVCPKCRNPFLIELRENSGKAFLKCPRATCKYARALPEHGAHALSSGPSAPSKLASRESPGGSPLRKAVRRRVVRKRR